MGAERQGVCRQVCVLHSCGKGWPNHRWLFLETLKTAIAAAWRAHAMHKRAAVCLCPCFWQLLATQTVHLLVTCILDKWVDGAGLQQGSVKQLQSARQPCTPTCSVPAYSSRLANTLTGTLTHVDGAGLQEAPVGAAAGATQLLPAQLLLYQHLMQPHLQDAIHAQQVACGAHAEHLTAVREIQMGREGGLNCSCCGLCLVAATVSADACMLGQEGLDLQYHECMGGVRTLHVHMRPR